MGNCPSKKYTPVPLINVPNSKTITTTPIEYTVGQFRQAGPHEIPDLYVNIIDVKIMQIIDRTQKGYMAIECQEDTYYLYYNNPNYAKIMAKIEIGKLYTLRYIDNYHPKFNFLATGQDKGRNDLFKRGVLNIIDLRTIPVENVIITDVIPIREFDRVWAPTARVNLSEVILKEQLKRKGFYNPYLRIFIDNSRKDKLPINTPCDFSIQYCGLLGKYIISQIPTTL